MQTEPDLEALRALALVAKESSMSAASAQLGVSQQAVSLRIRKLETDLRVRLLVRSARGSRLTPAGELIVGGKNGLEPVEKTLIDRSVRLVYQDFLADPVPEDRPALPRQEGADHRLAAPSAYW